VQKLSAGFATAMTNPEVRDRMLQWDSPPAGGTPEELGRFVQSEYARFAQIIKQANIPPQAT
jgi:tripartite-type tricarboxylate transporter receptor subunit TctC